MVRNQRSKEPLKMAKMCTVSRLETPTCHIVPVSRALGGGVVQDLAPAVL